MQLFMSSLMADYFKCNKLIKKYKFKFANKLLKQLCVAFQGLLILAAKQI